MTSPSTAVSAFWKSSSARTKSVFGTIGESCERLLQAEETQTWRHPSLSCPRQPPRPRHTTRAGPLLSATSGPLTKTRLGRFMTAETTHRPSLSREQPFSRSRSLKILSTAACPRTSAAALPVDVLTHTEPKRMASEEAGKPQAQSQDARIRVAAFHPPILQVAGLLHLALHPPSASFFIYSPAFDACYIALCMFASQTMPQSSSVFGCDW